VSWYLQRSCKTLQGKKEYIPNNSNILDEERTQREDMVKTSTKVVTLCDETHLDISREVARKPEGRRDHFWLLDELKTSLIKILFSCYKLGCIDYC